MNISQADLKRQALSFGPKTLQAFRDMSDAHGGGVIGAPLLIGFASRETDCQNIVGDRGFAHGMFQQDIRFWADWLHHQRGCKSGTNTPTRSHTAAEPDYVPTIEAGALKCLTMFVDAYHVARSHGYPHDLARHIATSAYNAGLGGALNGQTRHGNSDHYTTGGDYADDVLARGHAAYLALKAAKR